MRRYLRFRITGGCKWTRLIIQGIGHDVKFLLNQRLPDLSKCRLGRAVKHKNPPIYMYDAHFQEPYSQDTYSETQRKTDDFRYLYALENQH